MKSYLALRVSLLAVVGLLSFSAPSHATVVGYWRFEGNASTRVNDSSGNNRHLTNNSSNGSTIAGVNTPFGSTIPNGETENLRAASISLASTQYYTRADSNAFTNQNFTIEAYVQVATFGAGNLVRTIVSHHNANAGGATQGSWLFGVTGSGSGLGANQVLMQLTKDGTNVVNFDSDLTLTAGVNYYLAATVSTNATTGANVTFYLKDLSAGSSLVSTSATDASVTSIFNSNANFSIGASYSGGSAARSFDGLIDEVRLSNTVLSTADLLITAPIPEPSAYALGAGGLILAFALRRRPHRQAA